METLTIEFQPNLKSKILELLSSFSTDEVKVVIEDPNFEENKRKLDISYAKFKSGKEKIYSIEEVDTILDRTFSQYDR